MQDLIRIRSGSAQNQAGWFLNVDWLPDRIRLAQTGRHDLYIQVHAWRS